MSELQPPGSPPSDPDVASVTASAEEHASTLRATRDAHHEAQQMLALANEARTTATEEAERIVLEARDAADRARQELAGWAAAQRAKIDALAADMIESANRDADTIRAEALRTSMAEAEETSRAYVAEAAESAQRDGEAIRAEARAVLSHATELGEQVAEAMTDLTTTVADVQDRLLAARAAMEQLLSENQAPVALAEDLDESGDVGELDVIIEVDGEEPDLGDLDANDLEDEDDQLEAEAILEAAFEDVDETTSALDGADADESDHTHDRQLGSMFRRHGQRGD